MSDENILYVDHDVMKHLHELAEAHRMTVHQIGNIVLRRGIHPEGQPL